MNYSENKNNQKSLKNNFIYINNNKNNENDDEDDLTVIDSILIDNEYTYENDNETNDLKKKLNFNNVNNNFEIPNDKDLINLIEKTKDKFFDNLIEKNKELNNVCERHCKLIKSLNNYQNKLKEIKIKKNKTRK